MHKELYGCSSYYQLLLSLMRAMTENKKIDLFLEVHGIETANELKISIEDKIKKYVDRVYVCDNTTEIDPYIQRNALSIPWQKKKIINHINCIFNDNAKKILNNYDKINVYWDLSFLGTYLNINKIHYILHEDSLDSYKKIKENRPNYHYIFEKGLTHFAKFKLHTGVIPFGFSSYCDLIEVNDIEGIQIPTDKVIAVPRKGIEEKLTENMKHQIFNLFFASIEIKENMNILLTEPFFKTKRLPSEKAQIKLYKDLIEKYGPENNILIKPHPRDDLNYLKYFPKAKLLDKNVPTEVLNFDSNYKFEKAVTVSSSAIYGLNCTNDKIYLGADLLNQYR